MPAHQRPRHRPVGQGLQLPQGVGPESLLRQPLGMQAGTRKGRGGRGDTLEIPEGVAMTTVGESHGGPSSDAGKTEAEGRTKLRGLSEDSISILIEKRHELESHIIDTFDGKKVWFQERRLQFKGIPHITTDEWGVTIRFESQNFRTLSLSGRWDVIFCHSTRLGAHYAGWTLSFDCPYPELGISYG